MPSETGTKMAAWQSGYWKLYRILGITLGAATFGFNYRFLWWTVFKILKYCHERGNFITGEYRCSDRLFLEI